MSGLRRLTPLFDRVLVLRTKAAEKTLGGVLIPEKHQEKLREGTVVAVGPGARDKDGKIVPVAVAVGEKVLLPEYGGSTVKLSANPNDEFILLRDSELLGKLE